MRALVQTRNGPPEVLRVEERPEPEPGEGEVRIAVHACGLNFAEIQARMGLYPDAPKPPSVLGYEVAGVIDRAGSGVDQALVGQRVMAGTRFGGFAEYAVTNVKNVIAMPEAMGFVEAAAVPVVYATAYMAVARLGNVQARERILVHGAAGGVGIAAVQIARHRGAEVLGTASPGKHDAIRAQGVAHAIDYRHESVPDRVRAITNGKGVDVILDPRGGAAFKESYRLLRVGGRLVIYGANALVGGERRNLLRVARVALQMPRFAALDMMAKSKSVCATNMLTYWDDRGSLADIVAPIGRLLDEGVIKPVIAATFPLERAADAHRMIQERRNVGKVVLTVRE